MLSKGKSRISLLLLTAVFVAIIMFLGSKQVIEAQSASFYLKWTVDCSKSEAITISPRYDMVFDWKDPYNGRIEKIVPLALTCKNGTLKVDKICRGWISTRASQIDPMNKTHAACYAVP